MPSHKRERLIRSGKGETKDLDILPRPVKRQRQLSISSTGILLTLSPLLIHKDCFSVMLEFLEPRDWANLLLTGREWSSWVQESRVWYQFLQRIHTAALAEQKEHSPSGIVHSSCVQQLEDEGVHGTISFTPGEARRLVGALMATECLFHPGEEGFCGHPLDLHAGAAPNLPRRKAFLCPACRSRYRTGRVMKTEACQLFKLTVRDLEVLQPARERVWRLAGWTSIHWYRKSEVEDLASHLHGGLAHLGNKQRKRKIAKLLAALERSDLGTEEPSLFCFLAEASPRLRSACRSFLDKDWYKPPGINGQRSFARLLASRFCAQRVARRKRELSEHCAQTDQYERRDWAAVLRAPLFTQIIEDWYRQDTPVGALDHSVRERCFAELMAYFERKKLQVAWEKLWACPKTRACLGLQADHLRRHAAGPEGAGEAEQAMSQERALARGLRRANAKWRSLRCGELRRLKATLPRGALEVGEALGITRLFFRGQVSAADLKKNINMAVHKRVLDSLRPGFMRKHGLSERSFSKIQPLAITLARFCLGYNVGADAMESLERRLEMLWSGVRSELVQVLRVHEPALWWLAIKQGLDNRFMDRHWSVEGLRGEVERLLWLKLKSVSLCGKLPTLSSDQCTPVISLSPALAALEYRQLLSSVPSVLLHLRGSYVTFQLEGDPGQAALGRLVTELNVLSEKAAQNICTQADCRQLFSSRCTFQLCGTCCEAKPHADLPGEFPQDCAWHRSLLEN